MAVLKGELAVVADDGKDFAQEGLETLSFSASWIGVLLQEQIVSAALNLDQVGQRYSVTDL